jgi:hypothetical protein
MWARVSELCLGVWLTLSPLIFAGTPAIESFASRDVLLGSLFALLSLLSFWPRTAHAHLMTAALSLVLLAVAYFGWSRPGPPGAQNEITTALLLLMLAIVPNHANDPPQPWLRDGRTARPGSYFRGSSGG